MRAILARQRDRTLVKRRTGRRRPAPERHTAQRVAVLLGVTVMLGVICFHTELEQSDPAAGSVLAESPRAVALTYTTDVQLALSSVTVSSMSRGAAAPAGELAYLSADRNDILVLPLTMPLPSGAYTVSWRTAGPDGHPISGEFTFEVDLAMMEEEDEGGEADSADAVAPAGADVDPAAGDGAQNPAADRSVDLAALATRFTFYAAVVGILGAIAFRMLVLGIGGTGLPAELTEAVSRRVWRIAAIATALLFLTLPFRLWFQAVSIAPGAALGSLDTVTAGTTWSAGWWMQAGAGVLILLGIAASRPGRGTAMGWRLAALGALVLPVVPLVSGHAWTDSPRALSSLATYLHVVAASAWVGGLCCLVCAGLPALRSAGSPTLGGPLPLPTLVGAFSRLALAAVGLLIVSGATKAWLHIGAPADMWTTPWGRSLLVKGTVVLCVMALGFYNWRVVRPALAHDPTPDRLRRSARLELLLGVAALIATSFLVVQPLNRIQ